MKIRTKIILAFGAFLILNLTLGFLASNFLERLAKESEGILKDNYQSLLLVQKMNFAMARWDGPEQEFAKDSLLSALNQQLANVTEQGEQSITDELNRDIQVLLDEPAPGTSPQSKRIAIAADLDGIFQINQAKIKERNNAVNQNARKIQWTMWVIGMAAGAMGILFLLVFPPMISRPIRAFRQAIQAVSEGNYAVQIPLKAKNEFHELAKAFYKMAGKLKEFEASTFAEVLAGKKNLEILVGNMDEPILGIDYQKNITFVNAPMRQLLGDIKGDLEGKSAISLSNQSPILAQIIAELIVPFEPWEEKKFSELQIGTQQEERIFSKKIIDIVDTVSGETKDKLLGHIILLNDITQFKVLDRAKTEFMATLSHEIKTPLSAIDLSAGLLRNEKLGGLNLEQQEYTQTILENVGRIQRMVNELLEIARIESGIIEVERKPVNPNELLEGCLLAVGPFLKEKALNVELKIYSQTHKMLADPHKTIWVINNFLTNAIRYAPIGSTITLEAKEKRKYIEISVGDNGPGVSAADRKRIFEKFQRLSQDNTEGTGLGLAISRDFVEAMHGEIGVESEEGKGSRFWICLPVAHQP